MLTSLSLSVAPGTVAQYGKRVASEGELHEACAQFEALLVGQLFKQLRASVPDDGLIPRSNAEKTFQEMLDQQYALSISRSGTVGLADAIYRQVRQQTTASPAEQNR